MFRKPQDRSKYVGETITIPSLGESFIEIKRENTVQDIFTTIHEYAHATSILINPFHFSTTKQLYTEIDSIFMELIATLYLKDVLHLEDEAEIERISQHLNYYYMLESIIEKINLIELEKTLKNGYTSDELLKKMAKEYFNIYPVEIESYQETPNVHFLYYIIGYMYALELYNLYKQDREKALYILNKIILLKGLENEEEYFTAITKMGIIPNKSVRDYQKECEEVARILIKKNQSQ